MRVTITAKDKKKQFTYGDECFRIKSVKKGVITLYSHGRDLFRTMTTKRLEELFADGRAVWGYWGWVQSLVDCTGDAGEGWSYE
jgi:hypothetical protein